jgi:hypothetical protein
LHEEIDEQPIDRVKIDGDLLVALRAIDRRRGQLQAIQRALAGQRLARIPRTAAVLPVGSTLPASTASNGSARRVS